MERRIQRLEDTFTSPASVQMRVMATYAAGTAGLNVEDVLREADAVLTRIGGRSLSVEEIAEREAVNPVELARLTAEIQARWEEIAR